MHFEYETERLILKVLTDNSTPQVMDFYKKGAAVFDLYEPPKPEHYYTEEFQTLLLKGESQAFLKGTHARFYCMKKDDPDTIIGTVSFSNIIKGAYESCILGYKFLPQYQGQGYATEGISHLLSCVFREKNLHRIEAYTLMDNQRSNALLLRLGFSYECLARSVILLDQGFTDHNRYYLINPGHL